MKLIRIYLLAVLFMVVSTSLIGCSKDQIESGPDADAQGHTAPTQKTIQANAQVLEELPFNDQQDFEDAQKGLIEKDPDLVVKNAKGKSLWNQPGYEFIEGDAPASVNPSLWRQAKLNNIHGLFKVADGLYQVRGHDLANMTIIQGQTGWIIVDPLTAEETAERAMELARKHLGDQPVKAIIFTHSHIDHFGGALGVISAEKAETESVRIIAPKGFMEAATSENIVAGMAMSRRATYMYGANLARTPRGHIDTGLGKTPAYGTFGILEPTEIVDTTPQEEEIDGVKFIFQYAPESEAPAELTFYLPDLKAFCGAEIVSHNMHNLYTLRGAKVRNAVKWSNYINEAMDLFGQADVYFASHHWPMWGNERIMEFLKIQRDTYKYIHDQTVRLFNKGHTPLEIAEMIELPPSLQTGFANRGYYGTVIHNAKAVYQAYMGWYDGNPANLNPLPPKEAAGHYVELMGGGEEVLKKAAISFEEGKYRWVAQLLNHLVFAQPDNAEAKALLARTYDQLGYRSESGPWRDVYLTGAQELRHGMSEKGIDIAIMKGLLEKTPLTYFFDSMAVRLNGPKSQGKNMKVKIEFKDINESYELILENAVLHHRKAVPDSEADTTIRLTHDLFIRMIIGQAGIKETVFSDDLEVDGSKIALVKFLRLFEKPNNKFNIVTP